ncbi:MAG: TonB-dependent receptor [Salinivirgaceae bacterium]|jgi:outer membrane receptor for ferrienterochelin and colicin|nr:TonB-dependent receptor [Salinivirgaceae bacterium]
MIRKIILFALCLIFSSVVWAQKYTISGYITDKSNGEKLIGANVYDAKSYVGAVSNSYGFFSITLDKGPVLFTISYVGYTPYQTQIDLNSNTKINIELSPSIEIEEVVIEGRLTEGGVESTQMSVIEIPMKTIKNLPVLLGEADLIKAIQLLPGVQSGSEGMSGMYVRGGGPDQNLILLDGVPVYNVSHLFGFFSVFNSDAIQNVKLIKGGFPSRYGGRLSSVLDISMKEGNTKDFKASGSVGIISSKLTLEGPIGEKTSFIVSGRRTYIDILAYPFVKLAQRESDLDKLRAGYFFYDVNAKINHRFSEKSRLYLSLYMGKDKFYSLADDSYDEKYWDAETGDFEGNSYSSHNEMQFWWGNITSAARWNYMISNKLFANTTVTYSRYQILTGFESEYRENNINTSQMIEYTSGIYDWSGKVDFDYYPTPNHSVKFGLSNTYHSFNPGVLVAEFNDSDTAAEFELGNTAVYSNEAAVYIEDDIRIGGALKMNVGLRWSGFQVKEEFYNAVEPRFSARYLLSEKWSVKAAYAKMNQYINLLANSNIGLPFDLWVPSTDKIKPQKANQYALGSVYAINSDIDISVESFYKTMDNLVEYKEGASFFSLENDWEEKVTQGTGVSYGLEFLLMKKYGNATGWIGYTWSKSDRTFDTPGEEISFGKTFPYKYDRRHDLSIVLSYKLNEKIDVGATWVFGTGNATTLGYENYPAYYQGNDFQNISQFGYDNPEPEIVHYESRNNYRMPSYHRLDLSINFHKQKKWGKRIWNFSLYNAYNRKNPFMLQWERELGTNKQKLYQISLFPILPSVSYKFEF